MRRTALALALLLIPAGPLPSQAQTWGGGWRPCYGPCGPWMGGVWVGPPVRFMGPPAFAPGAWWSPRAVRWRRFVAWRRAVEAERRAEAFPAPQGPRFSGWVWRHRPAPAVPAEPARPSFAARPPSRVLPPRDEEAVAALPAAALHPAQPRSRPVAAARVLAAAAMVRHPLAARPVVHAVARVPEPAAEAEEAPRATASILRRPRLQAAQARAAQRPAIHPVALRSQPPAVRPIPAAPPSVPAPAPATPNEPSPAAGDVPVAPLD